MAEPEQSVVWYRTLEFFPALSEDDRKLCLAHATMVEFERGETIAAAHETADFAWVVAEGSARLVRQTPEGRTLAVDLLGVGEIVGEMAVLTGEPIPEAAEAMEDVTLVCLPMPLLRDICRRNATLSLHLARRVGRRRTRIEARLADLAYATVPVRVARLLAQLAQRFGEGSKLRPRIMVRLTHQDIAEFTGCSRESATRTIDHLMDRRVIAYQEGKIWIRSLPELQSCAEPR